MLSTLASQKLTGKLLKRNSVRIHAEPDVLEKLRTCGLGTRGSKRKAKARQEQEAAVPEVPTLMDITLEEGYFLQSSLGCLQVVTEAEQHEATEREPDADLEQPQGGSQAVECPALPVRVRHHGLHAGIVSRPGIHGLEEQLMYKIDTAGNPDEHGMSQAAVQEHACLPLTNEELWTACSARVPDWSFWYTTYHHFRSKGWLPKPGAQFGGHFVLYRSHPEVDHAEFVVRCMRGREPAAQPLPLPPQEGSQGACAVAMEAAPPATAAAPAVESAASQSHFAWPELLAALRVAGQVRKRLLLLYVHFPSCAQHGSPACLDSAMVAVSAQARVCMPRSLMHPGKADRKL